MGLASKLNTSRRITVPESINTKDIEYMSAADFADSKPDYPVTVAGFFVKKGEYGDQVTLIVYDGEDPVGVNIPKRYTDMFKEFTDDEVEDVLDGKLVITKIEKDVKTKKGKTTAITFGDVE